MGANRRAQKRLDEQARQDCDRFECREFVTHVEQREAEHQRRARDEDHETECKVPKAAPRKVADVLEQLHRRSRSNVPNDERHRVQQNRREHERRLMEHQRADYGASSSGEPAISPTAAERATLSPSMAHFMRAGLIPIPTLSSTTCLSILATASTCMPLIVS